MSKSPHTPEFCAKISQEYLDGDGSVDDIVVKYNISSRRLLRNWISRYNANRELKDYIPKKEIYIIYSWVKKYDSFGEEGLTDKQGRHKTDELERLRRENARLKRQLEEKDMLTELLKKIQEFERMWG